MQNSIYIDRKQLSEKVEKLRTEKEKMKSLFEKINNDVTKIPDYWSGDSGEKTFEKLSKHRKKYESIINEIESYISFLEKMCSTYSTMDSAVEKQFEVI